MLRTFALLRSYSDSISALPERNLTVIRGLIALCLLVQLLISWKVWLPIQRDLPLVPAFASLPLNYGIIFDGLLFGGAIVLLLLTTRRRVPSAVLVAFFMIAGLFVLEDITRLQPWFYFYCLALPIVIPTSAAGRTQAQRAGLLLMFSALYFWSALHKFNTFFPDDVFPWLMRAFDLSGFAESHADLAYVAPLVELMIAVGLLITRVRRWAIGLAIAMHCSLLFILIANSWNPVVWPWNLAQIVILLLMAAWEKSGPSFSSLARMLRSLGSSARIGTALIIVTCLPVFNLVGGWDDIPSLHLYSGIHSEAVLFYAPDAAPSLPAAAMPHRHRPVEGSVEYLSIDLWALNELGVPFYPEPRYYRALAATLCRSLDLDSTAGLKIVERQRWTAEAIVSSFSCRDLCGK